MTSSLVGFLALVSSGTAVFAADLLDAPGPGYRNQNESLIPSLSPVRLRQFPLERPTYRPDLLDALPPTRLSPEERAWHQELLLQRLEQFRGIRIYTNPLCLSLEIPLSPTILELPTENRFKKPFRLFTFPGDSRKLRGHIFRDQ